MGITQQHAQAWKFLQTQTSKVQDPILRNTMMAEFRKRALSEWGFDPTTGHLASDNDAVLDDWQQKFVADVQKTTQYELDVRKEQRNKTEHEAQSRMKAFVAGGGTLADIPEDIRAPYIEKLFYDTLYAYGDELMELANAVTNR